MKRALAFTLMVLAIMIIAVSCEEPQAHVHTYSEKWECDENYHWHEATCEHTDEVSDKEEHVWGDWITDKEATETEKGSKHRVCSVCERTETSDIAEKSHSHTYSTYQWSGSRHWRVCTTCGEELSSSTHSKTWNYDSDTHYQSCYCGWTTDKASHSFKSTTTDEKTVETCTSCGYSKTSAVTVKAKVEVADNLNNTEEKTTITKADGTTENNVTIVTNRADVKVTTTVTVASVNSGDSSSSSDSSSTGSSGTSEDDKPETAVVFPAGGLRVIKNTDDSGSTTTNVSLEIKVVTATEATSSTSESKYQTEITQDMSDDDKKKTVTTEDAVVAGLELKLTGADNSKLYTEDNNQKKIGTKITTYIAKNLCESFYETSETKGLTVKYVGTSSEDAPKTISYDAENGILVFEVFHFSKYAIVANEIQATDSKGNLYKTLANAVSSSDINEDGTITLLKDISLTEPVEITKSLVIDLNGKTFTTTGAAFNVKKGTLTIKNGTVKSAQASGYVISVESTSGNAGLILDSTATVEGTSCSGIINKGTSSYTATLNISGTVKSKGTAIYQQKYGSLTVNSTAKISSTVADDSGAAAGSAIEIGGGTAIIYGGTLTASASYIEPTVSEPSVVGAAVAIAQNSNGESISVSIYGGTFTANNGKQLAIINPNNKDVSYTKNVRVYVGSNVGMTLDKIVGTKTGNSSGIDGTYYLDSKSALKAGVGKVASISDENYASLEDAIIAASSGDEIILAKDVKVSNAITLKKGITLNLAENKLSFADGQNLIIQPDTPDNKKSIDVIIKNGSIDGGSGSCSVIEMCSYVSLTLDDVDMTANKVGNANALVFLAVGADPAKLVITNGSNLTMNGTYGVGTNATTNANVEITIDEKSKIVAQANGGESIGLFVNVSAKVSIDGATISGEKVGVLLRGIGKSSDSNKKAKIKNSTISSTGTGTYEMYEESDWKTGTGVPAAAIVVGNKNDGYQRSTTVEFEGDVRLAHASESAVDIYVYQENGSYPVTVSGDIDPIWTNNSDMNGATYPLAKIGKTEYTDLQKAIDKASSGQTVSLYKDVDLVWKNNNAKNPKKVGIIISKSITLEGNNHSLCAADAAGGENARLIQIDEEAGTVALKNLSVEAKKESNQLCGIQINNNGTTSLENVNIKLPTYYAINIYPDNDKNATVNISGGTIQAWSVIQSWAEDVTVNVENCNLISKNKYVKGGGDNSYSGIIFYKNKNRMTFTNCTFTALRDTTGDTKQCLADLRASNCELTLNGCKLNPVSDSEMFYVCVDVNEDGAKKISNEIYIEGQKVTTTTDSRVDWYYKVNGGTVHFDSWD